MIKKLFLLLGWLAGLLFLAAACWLLGIYLNWPMWRWPLVFVGALAAGWIALRLRRYWLAWRLRRRLARPVGNSQTLNVQRVDQDWKAGVRTLRESRLSRFGSPLYVLPWFIALGREADSKSDLLTRVSSAGPVHADGEELPTLRWWLLSNGVVLDPSDGLSNDNETPGSQYWNRILHCMLRTRRREPLNGMIIPLNAQWLLESDDVELAEIGRRLRKRLDELSRIYNVRLPIYVILTHCEQLPGVQAWGESLDAEMRSKAMGYLSAAPQESTKQFIENAFQSIVGRMLDLRVLQGMRSLPDADSFSLPERMATLAARLNKLIHPAFQATPYAETPLLGGLFLTAKPADAHAREPGWFMTELFDQILPMQRHAWQPIERWRHWRRLLRHAAVIGWLVFCTGTAVLMVHGSRVTQAQLHAIKAYTPSAFTGNLSNDLAILQQARDSIDALEDHRTWKTRWLPFQWHVSSVEESMRATYVQNFRRQIVDRHLTPLLSTSLPLIPSQKDNLLLAAWAENLVRQINLMNGVLDGQDVTKLPLPGSGLSQIYKSIDQPTPSPIELHLLGDLYRDYLLWETDTALLTERRNALRETLNDLELPERPIQWLYAWVELQGYLMPVRITDYWNIPETDGQAEVPAALTFKGERAVSSFLAELGTASGYTTVWEQRHASFEHHYLQTGLQAWHEFAVAFPYAADRLPDASARRGVLSDLLGATDPYRRLLADIAAVGNQLPEEKRPLWVQQAIRINELEQLAGGSSKTGLSAAVHEANVVNRLGVDAMKTLPFTRSIPKSLDYLHGDQTSLVDFNNYQKGLEATIKELMQGNGSAMQSAANIWAFGHDPNVKSVPLVDASNALHSLKATLDASGDSHTDPIWKVVQGPLDFTLDYAARSAACGLQNEWSGSVVNAVQGVSDTGLADTLLYGDRGQVNTFLGGSIKNFVDKGAVRYEPRLAMNRAIPLNGQFYAFINQAQLNQVSMLSDKRKADSSQTEIAALTQQNTGLEQQIAKLEATTASVTLTTVPTQVNPGARALPESVNLTVQCAAKTLTLENLNFPNTTTFPWSLASCSDTVLTIQTEDSVLVKQWSGARGFISFLREFSSGQRRYVPADFPDSAKSMEAAAIDFILVSYRMQGQSALLKAFDEADHLTSQVDQNKAKIKALDPGAQQSGPIAQPASMPHVPDRIASFCMGPVNSVVPMVETRPDTVKEAAKPRAPRHSGKKAITATHKSGHAAEPGTFSVQVGVFEHPEAVHNKLSANGYTVVEVPLQLKGKNYTSVIIRGYDNKSLAEQAAEKIGGILKLTPQVIRHEP